MAEYWRSPQALLAQGEALAFRHDLARQAVLEAISPQRKRGLHQSILAALISSPPALHNLARVDHHAEGTDDPKAILELGPAAGQQAAKAGAHHQAAAMWQRLGCPYEQAMALMDGDQAAQLAALELFERLGARPRRK